MAKKLKTRTSDLFKLSDADLSKEIEETYKRLFSLRLQRETGQLANHREFPKAKRQIARLKTIQKQRQLAKAGAGSAGQ